MCKELKCYPHTHTDECKEHTHDGEVCHCGCEEHKHVHENSCNCGCEEHKHVHN